MAKLMTDIALDTEEDLAMTAGDFTAAESTAQHQQQLILCNKGDYKQDPTLCAGTFTYMDDEQLQGLVRAISIAFLKDGMDVKNISLGKDGIIRSDAHYK